MLDRYNCIIGRAPPDKFEKEIKEWASEGKRWYTQRSLPWAETADEAYEYWAGEMGMTHPLMHAIRVAILGLLSQPEESCDIHPHVNYNVYHCCPR